MAGGEELTLVKLADDSVSQRVLGVHRMDDDVAEINVRL